MPIFKKKVRSTSKSEGTPNPTSASSQSNLSQTETSHSPSAPDPVRIVSPPTDTTSVTANSDGAGKTSATDASTTTPYKITPAQRKTCEDRFFEVPTLGLSVEQLQKSHEYLKLAVYCLVTLDTSLVADLNHRQLYDEARRQLRIVMEDESSIYVDTVEILTALRFLTYYEFSNEFFYRSWITVGTLVRLMVIDRMPRLDVELSLYHKHRSEVEKNEARLCFWNGWLLDSVASWTGEASPAISVSELRTFLCDLDGAPTGYNLTDDWRGTKLPIYAYIMIAAYCWEENSKLFSACFFAENGLLPEQEIRKRFAIRLQYLFSLRRHASRIASKSETDVFLNVLLQVIIQSALLQLCTKAIEMRIPYQAELRSAAFRTVLQLKNIEPTLGVHSAILVHTLFKAGLAMIKLNAASPDANGTAGTDTELMQGLTIVVSLIEKIAISHPGARNFVKQLKAGMSGNLMSESIGELVMTSDKMMEKWAGAAGQSSLAADEMTDLQSMFKSAEIRADS